MTELTIQASEELIKTFLQNLENKLSEITHKDSWASARYLAWRASFEGEEICLWNGDQYFTRSCGCSAHDCRYAVGFATSATGRASRDEGYNLLFF